MRPEAAGSENDSIVGIRMRWRMATMALLLVQFGLLACIAARNSPVCDEVGHLTAGIYHWKTGRFHLYRVNPPLVKMIAAIPAVCGDPVLDWHQASDVANYRPEWRVGQDFIRANGPDAFWYFTLGRLLCVGFAPLGGWFCYLWGRDLYGERSGFVACWMWVCSPTVLGWGSTFTPDVACASLGLAASYCFAKWLRNPHWNLAIVAGLVLGVAELTKTTWIVLFVLWPMLGWMSRWGVPVAISPRAFWSQLAVLLGLGVLVLNVGYGFEGTLTPLGRYSFVCGTLSGDPSHSAPGNRFAETLLGEVPVPLPVNYVRGLDLQKLDFEVGMDSYLCGEWSDRGWWYYHIVAWTLKEPLGFLGVLALAVFAANRRTWRERFSQQTLVLLIPAMAVFILVCSQSGFGRYIRYIIPCLPATFVLAGELFSRANESRWKNRLGWGCLVWGTLSSLSSYPSSISYFNEIAGGPLGGHRYLLDANVDWGQDLFRLKSWVRRHPEAQPLHVAHMGFVSAWDVGLDCQWPARMPRDGSSEATSFSPPAGWYVISVHELFGRSGEYRYLRQLQPVDRIGYSMWIYHIPPGR